MPSAPERFWSKVHPEPISGCWLWGASLTNGYGQARIDQRKHWAHRQAWEFTNGPIPPGFELHHTCENKACVNVDHLQPLSQGDHVRLTVRLQGPSGVAAEAASRTTCRQGHPFDERRGKQRVCSTCRRAASRRYMRRQSRENSQR